MSAGPEASPDEDSRRRANDDAARAIRFLAIKAAVFILVPLIAAIVAVVIVLG
ncbi:MAG: phosphoribosylformylglycinamidine synthase-associated small membrane protein [Hyphomonadaceae bacterium]